jgi:hypothetical protein
MRVFFLFPLFIFLCKAQNLFVWKPSISASDSKSYVDKQLPCQNDTLVIADIVYIDGPIKVGDVDSTL